MTIDATCIPHALASRNQWIVWKTEPRDDGGKPTKVPYQARYPDRKDSSTGPRTWASIETALRTYERGGVDGIGYVFSPDDPFAGFDLDNCIDERGTVAAWAAAWLDRFDTYIEVSPSGRGLKGIVLGRLPGSGVNAKGIEVYDQGRYFAITGQRWPNKPSEPHEVNGALDDLYTYAQQRKAQLDAERETNRQHAYAQKALDNECERLRTTTEGNRNSQLNEAAFKLAGYADILGQATIDQALTDAAATAGLGATEIRDTLRSGTRAGPARNVPPPKPQRTDTTDYVTATAEQTQSAILIEKLKILGYTFRLNLCTDTIEVNGQAMSDVLTATIRRDLRNIGLRKLLNDAEDAWIAEAGEQSYHPIRDYLETLRWDGADHIAALADYIRSSDTPVTYSDGSQAYLHHVYLLRWLVGAVAKVYTGCQNMMLVFDGAQGIGKSTLVFWLCPLPGFFIEGPINVADKDNDLRLLANWVWEVSELDATTRKADQSAIKSFITKQVVTVRKSYGRNDIKKPAMCSLIGTVNDTSGFLADESGSRRFLITKIDSIDIAYQQLDVHQIWAQAVALYKQGAKSKLLPEEAARQREQNERYEVATVLEDYIDDHCYFDPKIDEPLAIGKIITELARSDIHISGSERSQAMEIGRILSRRGARKVHTRHGNQWIGVGLLIHDDVNT